MKKNTKSGKMEGLSGVKAVIKSMVLSYNDNLTVDKLGRLYKSEEGEFIPARRFGYNSVELFLRSIPDAVSVSFLVSVNDAIFHLDIFLSGNRIRSTSFGSTSEQRENKTSRRNDIEAKEKASS